MSESSVSAVCKTCGGTVFRFDREKPESMVVCNSCETEVGTFAQVEAALKDEGTRVINDAVADLKRKLRRSGWK